MRAVILILDLTGPSFSSCCETKASLPSRKLSSSRASGVSPCSELTEDIVYFAKSMRPEPARTYRATRATPPVGPLRLSH